MNKNTLAEVEKFLVKEGLCSKCCQWIVFAPDTSWLPNHQHQGKECPSSHYSPRDLRYKLKNAADAKKLALLIAEDKGECLSFWYGGHSLACGDGNNCHETRRKLAQALAIFFLEAMQGAQMLYPKTGS